MNEVLRTVIAFEELKRMREAQEAERPRLYIDPPQPRECEEQEQQEEERGVVHISLDGSVREG